MGFVSTPAALFLKYTVSRMNCSFLLFPHSCTRELINDAVVSCNFTRGPVVVIYFWILSFQGFVAVNCIVLLFYSSRFFMHCEIIHTYFALFGLTDIIPNAHIHFFFIFHLCFYNHVYLLFCFVVFIAAAILSATIFICLSPCLSQYKLFTI